MCGYPEVFGPAYRFMNVAAVLPAYIRTKKMAYYLGAYRSKNESGKAKFYHNAALGKFCE